MGQVESNEQLLVLRNHLLALTRTEPQLQSIKDRAVEVSVQEPSVVEVMQLLDRVYKETYQQYYHLSERLIRSQDVVAALQLWKEYLTHVLDFLSSRVPGDYNGLSEQRSICDVHQMLLPKQHNLISAVQQEEICRDHSIAAQFISLTNQHNETLVKIQERQEIVQARMSAWNDYKKSQGKLLAWLKEVEDERQSMNLQFIYLKQLSKTLRNIQALLNKLQFGETQIKSLQEQQECLLTNCDEALAVSIRMEHAAHVQRISNLRASLETWRDFVHRVQKLNTQHVKQHEVVTAIFQEISQALSSTFQPSNLSRTKEQLEMLQHLITRLAEGKRYLGVLDLLREQMRGWLDPRDMKAMNHRDRLLLLQHGHLNNQLTQLEREFTKRYKDYDLWESQLSNFLRWMEDTGAKIRSYYNVTLDEPEETLERLKCDQAEMMLKQHDLESLRNTGKELMEIEESEKVATLRRSLEEVNEKWDRLMSDSRARVDKLTDLINTRDSLLKRIADWQTRLAGIENQLSEPIVIEYPTQRCVDKKLKDHEHLKTSTETDLAINDMLSMYQALLDDCNVWKVSFNTDEIQSNTERAVNRWNGLVGKLDNRRREIEMIWKLLQQLDEARREHEPWLTKTERSLLDLEQNLLEISKEESQKTTQIKLIAKDIEAHQETLKSLEKTLGNLAKTRLDPDNFASLTSEARNTMDRWLALEGRVKAVISCLEGEQEIYRKFVIAHGAVVVGLILVDAHLTQIQYQFTPEDRLSSQQRRQQLSGIKRELNIQMAGIQEADELASLVMQESPCNVAEVREMMSHYRLLMFDIEKRLVALEAELTMQESPVVDEAVQVETLKFEQDTAVQVDTLPRLVSMNSCNVELSTLERTLEKCNNDLDALERTVTPDSVSAHGLFASDEIIVRDLSANCATLLYLRNLLEHERTCMCVYVCVAGRTSRKLPVVDRRSS